MPPTWALEISKSCLEHQTKPVECDIKEEETGDLESSEDMK